MAALRNISGVYSELVMMLSTMEAMIHIWARLEAFSAPTSSPTKYRLLTCVLNTIATIPAGIQQKMVASMAHSR